VGTMVAFQMRSAECGIVRRVLEMANEVGGRVIEMLS
jgi:hypothetical protein